MASHRPWDADRPLTLAAVRSAILSHFPVVDVRGLEHLGSGWEFDAYMTADGWVFRFPRRAEYARIFERESAVHALLRPVLPTHIAIPRVELLGAPGPHFPYPFAGHRWVPGVSADRPGVEPAPSLNGEIGAALGAIHSVPEDDALAAGVEADEEGAPEWYREAVEFAPALAGLSPEIDAALEWLRAVAAPPGPYQGPVRLIHNDLAPEHLLVDAETGHLTGILDWTDAALGDPALDFAVLVPWRGWEFVEDARGAYGARLDPGFDRRVGFLARVLSLAWLQESRERGRDVEKHLRWVVNAFSGPDPL